MSRRAVCVVFLVICVALSGFPSWAANLYVLEGLFRQETDYTYTVTATPEAFSSVTLTIPLPGSTESLAHSVEIVSCEVTGEPAADGRWEETDELGNRWLSAQWYMAEGDVILTRRVRCVEETLYGATVTADPYPLPRSCLPSDVTRWLNASSVAQSADPQIRALVQTLTDGTAMEIEAVGRILAWVRSNLRYACSAELCFPVPQVDALFTLEHSMGNCVNFANLTIALLRAAGIPALSVNGFVADRGESHASHAWIAAFFPDLGWVEFESANWIPAYREVPVTFLLPQHISLYRGDGRGISSVSFRENHAAEFTVTDRPSEVSDVHAEVGAAEAASWVVTLSSPFSEAVLFTLDLEGIPDGWHADLSEVEILIDPDGVTRTRDVLLTIRPPEDVPPGAEASVELSARGRGEIVGTITATVQVVGE